MCRSKKRRTRSKNEKKKIRELFDIEEIAGTLPDRKVMYDEKVFWDMMNVYMQK